MHPFSSACWDSGHCDSLPSSTLLVSADQRADAVSVCAVLVANPIQKCGLAVSCWVGMPARELYSILWRCLCMVQNVGLLLLPVADAPWVDFQGYHQRMQLLVPPPGRCWCGKPCLSLPGTRTCAICCMLCSSAHDCLSLLVHYQCFRVFSLSVQRWLSACRVLSVNQTGRRCHTARAVALFVTGVDISVVACTTSMCTAAWQPPPFMQPSSPATCQVCRGLCLFSVSGAAQHRIACGD